VVSLAALTSLAERALDEPPDVVKRLCNDYYQPYYYLMYLLAQHINEGLFVELGVEKGRGCACLGAGGPEARVIGIDYRRHERITGWEKEFPHFMFLEQLSMPAPDLERESVTVLHIDTEHSYEVVCLEFDAYRRFLAPGAVVLFDDLHAHDDGVLSFFFSLPYPKLQDDRLHPICGYGALVYTDGQLP
jgi:predicted O-methyltransferase YrrM